MHVPHAKPLPQEFFARDPLRVARDLLGCRFSHGGVTVRLTEVEAYAGAVDPGSHAFLGRSPRNEVMFGPAGQLYVYFTYGMHFCANVVTGAEGEASAVLLRAGEVVDGHEVAAGRRPGFRPRDLARGPARLATTLALGREHNGMALVGARAGGRVTAPEVLVDPASVRTGPRVGVSGPGGDGGSYPWRFWVDGDPTVSAYRPGRPGNATRGAGT